MTKIIIRKQIKLEAETGPKMPVRTLGQMYLLLSSFLRPRVYSPTRARSKAKNEKFDIQNTA